MRRYELSRGYRTAFGLLGAAERAAVSALVAEFMDDAVPLVRAGDVSVTHGLPIMGRRAPGTDREELQGAWKPDARWLTGPGKDPAPRYTLRLLERES